MFWDMNSGMEKVVLPYKMHTTSFYLTQTALG